MMADSLKARVRDLDWVIGLNRISLRFMGVWPDDKDLKASHYTTFFRVPFMITTIVIFALIPQIYALVLVKSNLLLVLDNLMTSFVTATCCLKLFFLWRSKEGLRPVIKCITDDWLRPKEDWESKAMMSEATVAKFFTLTGTVIMGTSYVGFILLPLFGVNIRLVSNITDYGNRLLVFQSYYPYDYSKSPNYELTHISQVCTGTFISMALSIPDNYFGALVYHLSGQFQILGQRIEHLIQEDNNVFRNLKVKDFNRRLKASVNRHVYLVKMVYAVEKSFTFLILVQLGGMCVMTCCLGFRILNLLEKSKGSSDNVIASIMEAINLVAGFFCMLLFTFTECSASEELRTQSTGLFFNICNCKLYLVPKECIRDLILMMMMTKNPLELTAGKILYLSLECFCSLLEKTGNSGNAKASVMEAANLGGAFFSLLLFTFTECSASEELKAQSTAMFSNTYNCKWYLVPKDSTRDLILTMIMTKSPLQLTAGKLCICP